MKIDDRGSRDRSGDDLLSSIIDCSCVPEISNLTGALGSAASARHHLVNNESERREDTGLIELAN